MIRKEDWHMGKTLVLAGFIAAVFTTAACADNSTNPMVWSKHQWRSDLFKVSSLSDYARVVRVRREVRRIVRVEKRLMVEEQMDSSPEMPRRAKLIRIGGGSETGVSVNSPRPGHSRCTGMLILTWTGSGTTSKCHRGGGARQ
jgi:hypothetical protein